MFSLKEDSIWEKEVRNLPPNWDGEGAVVPTEEAIIKAKQIIDLVNKNNLIINSVDADVLGGIAIYLDGVNNKRAWISVLNDNSISIILIKNTYVTAVSLSDDSFEKMKLFLTNS